jgi:glycine oxidase
VSTDREFRRVVVMGGGVIGCSIAWRLAQRGLEVTVVESKVPGRGATWAAAGMLSPLGETRQHPDFLQLGLRSRALYPEFLAEVQRASGLQVEHGFHGKLEVAFKRIQLERFRAAYADTRVQFLSPAEVRDIAPQIAQRIAGGVWFEHDGFVDNRRLGEALWRAAERAGVAFVVGENAIGLTIDDDEVEAVTTSAGELSCDAAVVAAGAWSADLQRLPRRLPVFPVRGQMVALRADDTALPCMLQSTACYLIPRAAGRVLVGATVEQVAFDARNTVAGIHSLLAGATRLVQSLGGASVEEMWTGFRPCTPDELPVLGADPQVRGLFYATGHYRNGILLAPITAEVMSSLMAGGESKISLHTFRSDRFV